MIFLMSFSLVYVLNIPEAETENFWYSQKSKSKNYAQIPYPNYYCKLYMTKRLRSITFDGVLNQNNDYKNPKLYVKRFHLLIKYKFLLINLVWLGITALLSKLKPHIKRLPIFHTSSFYLVRWKTMSEKSSRWIWDGKFFLLLS